MAASPAGQPTVLVIDDALESVDVLRGILDGLYKVKAAIHSRQGLELARSFPPDLILLDVMMPELDGYGVCQELKRDPRTRAVPVIFITTLSDVANEARGLELGAVDYIAKPFVPELVRARVRTHVALYHQTVQLDRLVQERTEELVHTRLEIIRRLGRAAEYRDNETGLHVVRMSHYAHLISRAYGFADADAELCLNAAPMHDIGKIGTPDSILLKPDGLTREEWQIMQRHTVDGAEIIGEHPSALLRAAREVALHHHERWDGNGYPSRLHGEQIPLLARIVALGDVLDALLSPRPYKGPWATERALAHIEAERGRHFDPRVVDAFREVLPDCLAIHRAYEER